MGTDDKSEDTLPSIEGILDDEIGGRDNVERYSIIERTRHEAEVILFEEDETGAIKQALYQVDITNALDGGDYHVHWTFIGYRGNGE
ncbi:hypothetical protein [Halarchaeum nitratireducens]|uniref:Uncharacterized protein n=1 Tax=Halarchaeum nitratireducens TaxID=489913 RepID=A0A830GE19_9EURY|nr:MULTISPECIES: hypothetical protein [Halarchaeum]MBP2252649.1 methionine-rich copper-binding protein CopC [Halarchaeum solikamskense]GGN23559.1 hypothetical protein GCM10009021_26420 [Halarchaeum nitratireducens]